MWVPLTPLDFYRRSRRLFARKCGVVDQERRLSFGEFGNRVERLAGALRTMGLKPKERVSTLTPNSHHLLEGFYGIPLAGGVINPVNPRLAPLEIAQLLNDAGSRILCFHKEFTPIVRHILGNLKMVEQFVILEGDPRTLDFPAVEYDTLLERATPYTPDLAGLDEDAPMAHFYTTGGMVEPHGVLLSHRTLALHALYAVIAHGLREEDVSLCSVPFSYMNGGGNPQVNLAVASTSVIARRNDPETLLRLVEGERVTVWITTPMVLRRLLASPQLDQSNLSSLRLILSGGAPLSLAMVREVEKRIGCRCVQVYGLTETSPTVTAAFPKQTTAPEDRQRCQATSGLPILGVEVAVVNPESGHEVPADGETVGEILVRGNGVMTGYARDPEATQEALRGGWLHTGDLATVDQEGYLTITGHKKDVVLVGGMSVSAKEIEATLASHPDIVQCTVIASIDPERGEAPIGLVVLRNDARVTERDLIDYAKERLAWFKVPRSIQFLGSLPMTESGEVLKSELRTFYANP
ncbi:MAG TPA: AMP-binding protein [Methylomirabilota bacterium]|nr:AMP-binding protein [Methylomirabilota bacterium]